MKKWHVEGILNLNDFGKPKMAVPEAHQSVHRSDLFREPKKEIFFLPLLRWIAASMMKTL